MCSLAVSQCCRSASSSRAEQRSGLKLPCWHADHPAGQPRHGEEQFAEAVCSRRVYSGGQPCDERSEVFNPRFADRWQAGQRADLGHTRWVRLCQCAALAPGLPKPICQDATSQLGAILLSRNCWDASAVQHKASLSSLQQLDLSCLTAFRHPRGVGRSQNQPADWHAPSETATTGTRAGCTLGPIDALESTATITQ